MALCDAKVIGHWPDRRAKMLRRWTGAQVKNQHLVRLRSDQSVCVFVASHSSQHPEWSALWRHRLIDALLRCKARNGVALYCLQTPMGYLIRRFADQLGVASIELCLEERVPTDFRVDYLSLTKCKSSSVQSSLQGLPLPDRSIMALADCVYVIEARPKSKTCALAERCLKEGSGAMWTYQPDIAQHWRIDLLTTPNDTECRSHVECSPVQCCVGNSSVCRQPIVPFKFYEAATQRDSFLVHCTRGRGGQFPRQSELAYAMELLTLRSDVSPDALTTLQKILSDRRIIATNFLKRNQTPSVSWSAVPLRDLLARRRFRSHLHRWDWEPFGVAIRRSVLSQLFDTQPVRYLGDMELAAISPAQSGLVQPRQRRDGTSWQEEQEWRSSVDIRLSKILPTDAFVFVSNIHAARSLCHISPFPIVIVAGEVA